MYLVLQFCWQEEEEAEQERRYEVETYSCRAMIQRNQWFRWLDRTNDRFSFQIGIYLSHTIYCWLAPVNDKLINRAIFTLIFFVMQFTSSSTAAIKATRKKTQETRKSSCDVIKEIVSFNLSSDWPYLWCGDQIVGEFLNNLLLFFVCDSVNLKVVNLW